MTKVPLNRYGKFVFSGCCGQVIEIVGLSPTPLTYCSACGEIYEGDKIDSQSVIMRGLPTSRFRGPDGEQVILSDWAAVALENLELRLRELGFIRPREVLRQTLKAVNSFRVEFAKVDAAPVYYTGHAVSSRQVDAVTAASGAPRRKASPKSQGVSTPVASQAQTALPICNDCDDSAECRRTGICKVKNSPAGAGT